MSTPDFAEQHDVGTNAIHMLTALDLPTELHGIQNAYWERLREWRRLEQAYALVVADMLNQRKTEE